jgi:hypothetical protein
MLCLPLKCSHFFLRKLKAKLAFAPTAPRAFDCADRLAKKKAEALSFIQFTILL